MCKDKALPCVTFKFIEYSGSSEKKLEIRRTRLALFRWLGHSTENTKNHLKVIFDHISRTTPLHPLSHHTFVSCSV